MKPTQVDKWRGAIELTGLTKNTLSRYVSTKKLEITYTKLSFKGKWRYDKNDIETELNRYSKRWTWRHFFGRASSDRATMREYFYP